MVVDAPSVGAALSDDLCAYHAPALTGPWEPHELNPVLRSVVRARPAGHVFRHEGRLIRPAQDCSVTYGYATVFNEIQTLTPSTYVERPLGRLDPVWLPGLTGIHTYNTDGHFEVVDSRRVLARLPRSLTIRARQAGLLRR